LDIVFENLSQVPLIVLLNDAIFPA